MVIIVGAVPLARPLASARRRSRRLARKHLHDGTLVLYDVSSSYMEGRCDELAQLGYDRDRQEGQVADRLRPVVRADGCPVIIEVFDPCGGRRITASIQVIRYAQEIVNIIEILSAE
jgi:hypothetical protein